MNQRLHNLLLKVGLPVPSGLPNPLIKEISCDSRSVGNGGLFCGLPGERVDGGKFWLSAMSVGAVAAVISESAAKLNPPGPQDAVVVVPEPVGQWVGELASAFWEAPSTKMALIGVTGTNGKTTTTYLIEHLSKVLGTPTALFGTLVTRWPSFSSTSTHTTSFADILQAQLAGAIKEGAALAAMEVSSHALAQKRVAGCSFSGVVFTNLTQDHLDYHSSMEEYFETKSLLFRPPFFTSTLPKAVVNIDDSWGARLAQQLGSRCWRCSLLKDNVDLIKSDLSISDIRFTEKGVTGLLKSPVGEGRFNSPLLGNFNLMNLLQAIGVLLQQGYPLNELLGGVSTFPGVPGRMELINLVVDKDCDNLPTVVVDYAHTPDGLKNAILASRSFVKGKLICVFGCGGDRDKGKRPQMGAIATELADYVILTSDNPRTEDPTEIIDDVLKGIFQDKLIEVQIDRFAAIEIAINSATKDDLVLIAGKGHEDYQILGTVKQHFDDREHARRILSHKLTLG